MKDVSFGQILVENGLITKAQLDEAVQKQKNSSLKKALSEILLEDGVITERVLDIALAAQRRRFRAKMGQAPRKPTTESRKVDRVPPSAIDPSLLKRLNELDGIKDEFKLLREEVERMKTQLKREIMTDIKGYVRQQVKRAMK